MKLSGGNLIFISGAPLINEWQLKIAPIVDCGDGLSRDLRRAANRYLHAAQALPVPLHHGHEVPQIAGVPPLPEYLLN